MEESVREDLNWIKDCPLVGEAIKNNVTGMLFHVETGRVEVIV